MNKVIQWKQADFTKRGNDLTNEAGRMLAEAFNKDGQTNVLKENFGITFKEDGQTTTTDSGAYTTLLSSTLYSAALEKIEKIIDLVEINEDLKNANGGFGAYKLPRLQPTIATEIAEGAVINYFSEGIDSITVTPRKVVAGTSITWEMMKRGMTDFAKYVLKNAADSVSRKLASDIVNGLAAGAGTTTAGGVTFANVLTSETAVNDASYGNGVKYGFIADALVIAAANWNTFRSDGDVKASIYFASAVPGQPINAATMPLMFGNLEIVVTPFLTGAQALVLEKKRNVLVKESDLESFEGRIPGRLYDTEVVCLMSYVMAMLYPDSVAAISA